ncbi:uncharacterized protein ASCRUDRAFT_10457 [Ascoidea rubescens DSM 1968]|uniref:HTH APSES-type domain-containing protein n=1 Tax=Ascoidea rubescens DSM 1968 TaxID=1344418 RepID=A0A1D2V994_9ASCO|nr:hypothetical protein ASCRUDRAFT_10457 [Ascoidea rubescens DSM 1968]ODV58198.1 hypothetical protein ASCRUDRAFT_10457 [Ascoidea rubescens DSM 1968]
MYLQPNINHILSITKDIQPQSDLNKNINKDLKKDLTDLPMDIKNDLQKMNQSSLNNNTNNNNNNKFPSYHPIVPKLLSSNISNININNYKLPSISQSFANSENKDYHLSSQPNHFNQINSNDKFKLSFLTNPSSSFSMPSPPLSEPTNSPILKLKSSSSTTTTTSSSSSSSLSTLSASASTSNPASSASSPLSTSSSLMPKKIRSIKPKKFAQSLSANSSSALSVLNSSNMIEKPQKRPRKRNSNLNSLSINNNNSLIKNKRDKSKLLNLKNLKNIKNLKNLSTKNIIPKINFPYQPSKYTDSLQCKTSEYCCSKFLNNTLNAYEYKIGDEYIIWHMTTGHILFTNILKILNYKVDIPKLVKDNYEELDPNSKLNCSLPEHYQNLIKVKGGVTKIQGTYISYEFAYKLATKIAYKLRYVLVPLFGEQFLNDVLPFDHPFYGKLIIDDNKLAATKQISVLINKIPLNNHLLFSY